MQVTDEMIERAQLAADALNAMVTARVMRAALTAALSDQERAAVRALPLKWSTEKRSGFTIHVGRGLGLKYEAAIKAYSPGWIVTIGQSEVVYDSADSDEEAAKTAAQADYEQRIRSALVDVPVEPVAGKFKLHDRVQKHSGAWWEGRVVGFYSTKQTPVGYCVQFDTVENGPVQIYPEAALELSPTFSSPHREGEDSAEVERLTRPIVGIEHRTAQEVFDIMADRIRLAATRSGSATDQKGCAE